MLERKGERSAYASVTRGDHVLNIGLSSIKLFRQASACPFHLAETFISRYYYSMNKISTWWDRLRVEAKDGVAVLILSVPFLIVLGMHITLLHELRSVQERSRTAFLLRDQVNTLARLAVDIEDAFRGYLLAK